MCGRNGSAYSVGSTLTASRGADVPPGRYRLDVWHPRLKGDPRRDIVVTADTAATQSISVSLKPDKRLRRAPDGGGGGYK